MRPIIDEGALNPKEFTLLEGIYGGHLNKSRAFPIGAMPKRDYSCLDFGLTSLNKEFRRYMASSLEAVDNQLKAFVKAHAKQDEAEYESNPTVY